MKMLPVSVGLILFCGLTGSAYGDIFSWVDADGIRHFSNHIPPKTAENVEISMETPHVPPSAGERLEAQREEILTEARQKIAEMEAASMQRLRSAERKIEAAKQEAAQALEDAEELMKAAEEKSKNARKTVVYYGYFPYYPRKPIHKKPVHLPAGIRKDLQYMQSEGGINRAGQKPRKSGRGNYLRQLQPKRVQRSGGVPPGAGMPPGFLLRAR